MLAQHRGHRLNDPGVDILLVARQLLGGGRKPVQQAAVGVRSGRRISGRSVGLPRCAVPQGQIAQFLRQSLAWSCTVATRLPTGATSIGREPRDASERRPNKCDSGSRREAARYCPFGNVAVPVTA